MFEILFLGTAAGVPAVDRGLPALLVSRGPRRFLVDCGEGTQRQLLTSGIGLRRLNGVLLTHAHLDHLLGVGGLVATLALFQASRGLAVYGGAPALRAVRALLTEVVWPDGPPPFEVTEVALAPGTIIEDDQLRVRAFPVTHRAADSFGFAFEDKPRPRLRPDRLAALGVPAGPERRRLLEGEVVRLPDGRRIAPEEVLAPPRAGCRLVVVGDAANPDELLEPARGADALVVEATFLERDAELAASRSHLTAAQSARLARDASARTLHPTPPPPPSAPAQTAAEARAIFPGAVVARDFDRVAVRAAL